MRIHLVNPSDVAFGVGVITPRWLYVLSAATPEQYGNPVIVDETLESIRPEQIRPGDVVGIGIHTANALRGYEIGRLARVRGAFVVFGGIHATLYPAEAREFGAAHAVVQGDGDVVWSTVLADCMNGRPKPMYNGGRVSADRLLSARWDLLPPSSYMWASVQTVRGCPKHCSFCSVWRTDGQKPRQRSSEAVMEEIVQLRRLGYRFIALADDNFYSVTMADIASAERQSDTVCVAELRRLRAECFKLMDSLAELPPDTIIFTQITMEAAEDPEFLDAMRKARIKGALVGIEAVTPEGLKSVYKDFNPSGENLVQRLRLFKSHGVHVLGSFIFGLPTDRQDTFEATVNLAKKAGMTFAQFVMMTPFPGTVDFDRWEKSANGNPEQIDGIPVTRYWLIPGHRRPKLYMPHPSMSPEEIRMRTQGVWDSYYSLSEVWKRARFIKSLKARLAFVFISKLYRQMYANIGIATDTAHRKSANRWARWMGLICIRLFRGRPMPHLQVRRLPEQFLTNNGQ
jgi:radical SAM superfamily enzyme YgiQ (UPF0313 family)